MAELTGGRIFGVYDAPIEGGKWGNRFSASIDSYQAGMQGVGEELAGAAGLDSVQGFFRSAREENEAQAEYQRRQAQRQGAIMSYKDVGGVGDALDYVGGLAVDSLPYLAESALGGVAGRALLAGGKTALGLSRATAGTVGGVAASYTSAVGDILQNQREEPGGQTTLGAAALGGIPYAGLNALGVSGAASRAGGLRRAGIDMLDNMGANGGSLARVGGALARTGVAFGKNALEEGIGETGQEIINQGFGRMAVNPDQTLFNPEANERYLESFIGGAALGGVVGGAAGGWRRSEGFRLPADQSLDDPAKPADLLGSGPTLGLGYSPLAGTPTVFPDGSVALNGEQELAHRYAPQESGRDLLNLTTYGAGDGPAFGVQPQETLDQLRSDLGEAAAMAEQAYRTGDQAQYEFASSAMQDLAGRIQRLETPSAQPGQTDLFNPDGSPTYGANPNFSTTLGDYNLLTQPAPIQQRIDQNLGIGARSTPQGYADQFQRASSEEFAGRARDPATQVEIPMDYGQATANMVGDNVQLTPEQQMARDTGKAVAAEKQRFAATKQRAAAAGLDVSKGAMVALYDRLEQAVAEGVIPQEALPRLVANVVNKVDTPKSIDRFIEAQRQQNALNEKAKVDELQAAKASLAERTQPKQAPAQQTPALNPAIKLNKLQQREAEAGGAGLAGELDPQVQQSLLAMRNNPKVPDVPVKRYPNGNISWSQADVPDFVDLGNGYSLRGYTRDGAVVQEIKLPNGMRMQRQLNKDGTISAEMEGDFRQIVEGQGFAEAKKLVEDFYANNGMRKALVGKAPAINEKQAPAKQTPAVAATENVAPSPAPTPTSEQPSVEVPAETGAVAPVAKAVPATRAASQPVEAPGRAVVAPAPQTTQPATVAGIDATKTVAVGRSGRQKRVTPAQIAAKLKGATPARRRMVMMATGLEETTDATTGAPTLVVSPSKPMTYAQIARTFNVSPQSVQSTLADFGIDEGVITRMQAVAAPDPVSEEDLAINPEANGSGIRVEDSLAKATGQGLVEDGTVETREQRQARIEADRLLKQAGAILSGNDGGYDEQADERAADAGLGRPRRGQANQRGYEEGTGGAGRSTDIRHSQSGGRYQAGGGPGSGGAVRPATGETSSDAGSGFGNPGVGIAAYGTGGTGGQGQAGARPQPEARGGTPEAAGAATRRAEQVSSEPETRPDTRGVIEENIQALLNDPEAGNAAADWDSEVVSWGDLYRTLKADWIDAYKENLARNEGEINFQELAREQSTIEERYQAIARQQAAARARPERDAGAGSSPRVVEDLSRDAGVLRTAGAGSRGDVQSTPEPDLGTRVRSKLKAAGQNVAKAGMTDEELAEAIRIYDKLGNAAKAKEAKAEQEARGQAVEQPAPTPFTTPTEWIKRQADTSKPLLPGLPQDTVQQMVDQALDALGVRDKVRIEVHRNPASSGVAGGDGVVATGANLSDGRILLFSDFLPNRLEVLKTVFHELFHSGLSRTVSQGEYIQLMLKFKSDPTVRQYAQRWKESEDGVSRRGTMPVNNYEALAVEEALAQIGEAIGLGEMGSAQRHPLVRNVIKVLSDLADMLGFRKEAQALRRMTYTAAEQFVADVLQRSDFAAPTQLRGTRFRQAGTTAEAAPTGGKKVVFAKPPYMEQVPSELWETAQGALGVLRDWTFTRGAFTRDLLDAAAKMMPAAQTYRDKMQRARVESMKLERDVAAITDTFAALPAHERGTGGRSVNALIRKMTYENKWAFAPSWVPNVTPDPELAEWFEKGLSADARKVVIGVFQHGHETLKQVQQAALDSIKSEVDPLIADARAKGDMATVKELEKAKVKADGKFRRLMELRGQTPYAPLRRFGNWAVVAKSRMYQDAEAAGDKDQMDKLSRDGKHYHVEFAPNRLAAAARAKKLKAAMGDVSVNHFERSDDKLLYGGESMFKAFSRFRTLAREEMADGDAKVVASLDKTLASMYMTLVAETSARTSEFERKNVSGADGDMMRAFATQGRAMANFIGSLKTSGEIMETLRTLKKQSHQGANQADKSVLYNEIMRRHAMGMNYEPNQLLDKSLAANSYWSLITSPSYFLTNLTQPWVASLPVLAGRFGVGRSTGEMFRAYKEIARIATKLVDNPGAVKDLPKDVQKVVEELLNRGSIDISVGADLGQFTSGGNSLVNAHMERAIRMPRTLAERGEMVNRVATAVAAYRLARGSMPEAAAIDYADKVIYETHGDYSAFNAPRVMRNSVGRFATQFRKFQLIQISLYARLFRDAFAKLPSEERFVARKALAYSLGMTFALGGMTAMPGYTAISFILGSVLGLGDDDEPDDPEATLRRALGGGPMAGLLIRGVPNLAGINIGSRIGAAGMLSILPYTDLEASRDGYKDILLGLAGPFVGGTLPKALDGLGLMLNGDYPKGLEMLLPRGLGDALKGVRFGTEGVTKRNGDVVLSGEEVSFLAAAAQAIGLPTTSITDNQMLRNSQFKADDFYKDRTTQLKRQYVEAYREGDGTKLQEVRQAWMETQEARKRLGYDVQPMSTLLKAPQEQRKREAKPLKTALVE